MSVLWRCLQALGLNAVPAGGFLLGSWSWDTALKLYWFENLVGGLLIGLRIALHRRWTGKRGHFRPHAFSSAPSYGKQEPAKHSGSLLASFLAPTMLFTVVHGFFIGVLGLLPGAQTVDGSGHLRAGALAIAALLLAGFLYDLVSLRERSLRWVLDLAEYHLGRVVLVQLAIVGGFMFMVWWGHRPQAFFLAFAGLKTMADISGLFVRAAGIERVEIETPPPWLARTMNKMGSKYRGEDFLEYWQRQRQQDAKLAEEDEEVRKPGTRG